MSFDRVEHEQGVGAAMRLSRCHLTEWNMSRV